MVYVGYLVYSFRWYCSSVYLGDASRGELRMIRLISSDLVTIQEMSNGTLRIDLSQNKPVFINKETWIQLTEIIRGLIYIEGPYGD